MSKVINEMEKKRKGVLGKCLLIALTVLSCNSEYCVSPELQGPATPPWRSEHRKLTPVGYLGGLVDGLDSKT